MERVILIVEDEKELNRMTGDYLKAAGFSILSAYAGRTALELFKKKPVDLVIIDIMLPDLDGFELTRQIRAESTVPILILTALSGEGDRVLGLEIGADDYLAKPFSMKELGARVRALIRRTYVLGKEDEEQSQGVLRYKTLGLDMQSRKLLLGETKKDITATQFRIMKKFLSQPGRVFSRMDLLRSFQEDPYEGYERTIDAHIKNLRKLLETDPVRPEWIITVWGQGYKLGDE